jgi:hypothetical protein
MAWSLTLRDVTVGTVASGATWLLKEAPALFGIDSPRVNDANVPAGWGDLSYGADLPAARNIEFVAWSNQTTETAALAALETFQAAWGQADETLELTIAGPSRTWIAYGRPRRSVPNLTDSLSGIIEVACQFRALDPRLYDATLTSTTVDLGTDVGGLEYPFDFPVGFGSMTPGTATLTNAGNAPTSLLVTITPTTETITNPIIINQTTGERVEFDGLTIAPGKHLDVDFGARTVNIHDPYTAGGLVDAAATIDRTVSTWWTGTGTLPVGANVITTTGSGNGATVTYAFRSAWQL